MNRKPGPDQSFPSLAPFGGAFGGQCLPFLAAVPTWRDGAQFSW